MARRPVAERRQALQARMDDLQKQLASLEAEQIDRMGKIARDTGLLDLDLPDDTLAKAFADLVRRFREREKPAFDSTDSPPPPPAQA